jgi:glycosyltransferase involved in cell wall biosynthesis
MNILYFSYSFPSINSRFIRDELEYFNKHHGVVYLHHRRYNLDDATKEGIKSIAVPFNQNVVLRKLNWWLWRAQILCSFSNEANKRSLLPALMSFQPDVIHCHFAYEGLALYDNYHFTGPWIFHFHGYDASEMLNNAAYVRRLKSLSKKKNVFFLYVSQNIKSKLESRAILNPRSRVLHCGIDLNHFTFQQTEKSEILRFIHVSNLQEKKGLHFSLKAFQAFSKHEKGANAIFVVVGGTGVQLEEVNALIADLGLKEKVLVLGQKSKDEVLKELGLSNVFVHHSITSENGDQEGIPTAIMEAMALGLPVLSTYHSGIPELVEHGIHGYLSPEKDVADMTAQMLKIADWPSFRLKACREKIEQKFNKNTHLEDLMRFYQNAIKETTNQL